MLLSDHVETIQALPKCRKVLYHAPIRSRGNYSSLTQMQKSIVPCSYQITWKLFKPYPNVEKYCTMLLSDHVETIQALPKCRKVLYHAPIRSRGNYSSLTQMQKSIVPCSYQITWKLFKPYPNVEKYCTMLLSDHVETIQPYPNVEKYCTMLLSDHVETIQALPKCRKVLYHAPIRSRGNYSSLTQMQKSIVPCSYQITWKLFKPYPNVEKYCTMLLSDHVETIQPYPNVEKYCTMLLSDHVETIQALPKCRKVLYHAPIRSRGNYSSLTQMQKSIVPCSYQITWKLFKPYPNVEKYCTMLLSDHVETIQALPKCRKVLYHAPIRSRGNYSALPKCRKVLYHAPIRSRGNYSSLTQMQKSIVPCSYQITWKLFKPYPNVEKYCTMLLSDHVETIQALPKCRKVLYHAPIRSRGNYSSLTQMQKSIVPCSYQITWKLFKPYPNVEKYCTMLLSDHVETIQPYPNVEKYCTMLLSDQYIQPYVEKYCTSYQITWKLFSLTQMQKSIVPCSYQITWKLFSLTQMQKSIVPCSYQITWKLFKPYPNVEKYCTMLLSDHVETIQALPKCRKVLYHAPIRSRGNYSSLTQMQKSIVPCSYDHVETIQPYPNVEKYCTMIRSRGNYSSLTQMQKSIVPCSYQITWKLFSLTQMQKSIVPCSYQITWKLFKPYPNVEKYCTMLLSDHVETIQPYPNVEKYCTMLLSDHVETIQALLFMLLSDLTQMQKSIVPCSYQITWKLFKPYPNVEKYCTMLLSDHVETIQPYPNVEKYCTYPNYSVEKYCTMLLSDHVETIQPYPNVEKYCTMQKSIVPCSYQITWKLFKPYPNVEKYCTMLLSDHVETIQPYPNVEKYCTMLLSDHVETIQALPKCRKVLYHAPIRSRGNYSSLTQMQKSIVPCSYQITWKLFSLTQMQKSIVPCSYQITWKLFKPYPNVEKYCTMLLSDHVETIQALPKCRKVLYHAPIRSRGNYSALPKCRKVLYHAPIRSRGNYSSLTQMQKSIVPCSYQITWKLFKPYPNVEKYCTMLLSDHVETIQALPKCRKVLYHAPIRSRGNYSSLTQMQKSIVPCSYQITWKLFKPYPNVEKYCTMLLSDHVETIQALPKCRKVLYHAPIRSRGNYSALPKCRKVLYHAPIRSRGNYSSLTQMQKSIVPCSYQITWKLFKPYPNVEKYCTMLLSDHVETIQALPKCRKVLYHAPIRSRGNYSSLTQMQKSIVPCSYQITWKLFKPYPNVEKYCTMLLSDHVETIQALPKCRKVLYHAPIRSRGNYSALPKCRKVLYHAPIRSRGNYSSLTQMQKSIVPCSYQITWKLFKPYPNVEKYCTMLLSDHVETIQALPKCRKVLYHAPIRSRGNYSSLTQMQKSIVPCSYQITWKLFSLTQMQKSIVPCSYQITWKLFKPYPNVEKYCTMLLSDHVETIQPYPNVEKYCTMLLSDHVETIQALPKCRKVLYHAPIRSYSKCRKVLYHAPIRSRGNYSSLTQMQKSIVPCSYQITWKLFSLTQMQKSIVPCSYQITWKLFKPYPNVEKYCTMLLSDHVETIQPYPNVEKYCTMLLSDHVETIQALPKCRKVLYHAPIRSRGNYSSLTQMQKSIVPCSYQITWKLFKPYPNVEKYCTMLLSDHVETIQALPKCRKVLYHAPIRSRGNYSALPKCRKVLYHAPIRSRGNYSSLTQMQKSIVPCSYQITWKLFKPYPNVEKYCTMLLSDHVETIQALPKCRKVLYHAPIRSRGNYSTQMPYPNVEKYCTMLLSDHVETIQALPKCRKVLYHAPIRSRGNYSSLTQMQKSIVPCSYQITWKLFSLTQMQKSIVPCSYQITWKLFKPYPNVEKYCTMLLSDHVETIQPYPNVEKYCTMLLSDHVETIQALPKCRKVLYHAPIRSRGNYSSLTQMQKSIVPCSYQITWKLFKPYPNVEKYCTMLLSDHVETIQALPKCRKVLYHAPIRSRGNYSSLTQMQKSIVPCSYQITWKLFKPYPNVEKYCTMLLSDHVETIQALPKCRKVLYHAPIRSRGNYSSLTQMQKSIVPCSYQITWKLFKPYPNVEKYCTMLLSDHVETIQALPKCRKVLYHAPIRSRGNYSSLTQMQKSIVPCSYQITWKLFKPYPNVEKYCTMLLSDHVETIQALPKCRKVLYHAPIRSRGNYSALPKCRKVLYHAPIRSRGNYSVTQMQKSIVPCSYQITWKLFKPYPNVEKYCTMLLSDHVETIQALPKCRKVLYHAPIRSRGNYSALPKCRKVLYHAPIRSRGNYSALPKCRKVLYHAPIRSRGNYSSLTQMQKSIVPCSYQITWKLFKPYPNVEKYCTMLLSDHVETIQALPKCEKYCTMLLSDHVETIQPYPNVEKYCTMLLSDHVETIQAYPNVEKYCTMHQITWKLFKTQSRKVLYHAPIRSRGNYSSLTQMQKSIVPCSYQITWKLFKPYPNVEKYCTMLLSDHVETIQALPKCRKVLYHAPIRSRGNYSSLTQMQKSIVPCSYQITWKLFSLTQMQKSIVPCSYQITWKLFKPYPNVEKYCTMLLSDHVETIQALPKCRKVLYHAPIRSRGNYSSLTQMQKSIVPCSYQITWKLFKPYPNVEKYCTMLLSDHVETIQALPKCRKVLYHAPIHVETIQPYPNVEKYCTMLLSDHVETIQALPKCRKVLYHAPIRSRGNYSSLTQMQKSIVPCSYQITWKLFSLTQMQKSIVPCSYQITWKLFKPYPNVEKYCTMLLSDHVETIQALPKCRKVLYHAPIRSRGNYSSLTQMQKSIVPCSYQITWKLFSLTQMQKSIVPCSYQISDHAPISGNYSALPKCRKVLYHAPIRSRGNYSSLTQMQKSIVPCSYQITWKLFKPYPNVEKYCTMLLSDHVETIQALPKCRKVLYHAPIRSRGNYSSLTQMQKSIVPCSYQITWKLFKPYPNVEKYCTMLLSDHVETIQPYPNVEKYCTMLLSDHVETIQALPKCRKVLYHAPIRSRGNYSSLTQMQKSIVPCSYQITWKLFKPYPNVEKYCTMLLSDHVETIQALPKCRKVLYHAPIRSRGNYSSLTQMQKSIVPCSYQITWKLFKPYPNVEKYCTMLLSDHVETIQPYPNVEKYCTMLLSDHVETIQALPKCRKVLYHAPIRSRGNYSSLTQMQKSIVPCSYQITWKLFKPYPNVEKYCTMLLSDHVETIQALPKCRKVLYHAPIRSRGNYSALPKCRKVLYHAPIRSRGNYSALPKCRKVLYHAPIRSRGNYSSLTQMQKSIVPCSYQITWKLFKPYPNVEKYCTMLLSDHVETIQALPKCRKVLYHAPIRSRGNYSALPKCRKVLYHAPIRSRGNYSALPKCRKVLCHSYQITNYSSLTQMQKSIVPCSYQITWKLFKPYPNVEKYCTMLLSITWKLFSLTQMQKSIVPCSYQITWKLFSLTQMQKSIVPCSYQITWKLFKPYPNVGKAEQFPRDVIGAWYNTFLHLGKA